VLPLAPANTLVVPTKAPDYDLINILANLIPADGMSAPLFQYTSPVIFVTSAKLV